MCVDMLMRVIANLVRQGYYHGRCCEVWYTFMIFNSQAVRALFQDQLVCYLVGSYFLFVDVIQVYLKLVRVTCVFSDSL
jgi:hypothetical protein